MIFHTVLNNKKKIHSDYLQESIINLGDKSFIIPDSYQYEILEVTEKYIARPDLLSLDVYGDTLFADLLCKLNGISNPFELNKGTFMIIPSPDCIIDFMYNPEGDDVDSSVTSTNNTKPIAKKKNEKRKANESVIGDHRFKIDASRGIIIY